MSSAGRGYLGDVLPVASGHVDDNALHGCFASPQVQGDHGQVPGRIQGVRAVPRLVWVSTKRAWRVHGAGGGRKLSARLGGGGGGQRQPCM